MPRPLLILSQSDYLIQIVAINLHTWWQTVQIQISWLLQKPTDLDLHCLQNRVYPGSAGQGLRELQRPVSAVENSLHCLFGMRSWSNLLLKIRVYVLAGLGLTFRLQVNLHILYRLEVTFLLDLTHMYNVSFNSKQVSDYLMLFKMLIYSPWWDSSL